MQVKNFLQWQNVKAYLKNKYKIIKESDDTLVFGFAFSDGRSQVVFVDRVETKGGVEFVQLVSRIGEINPKRIATALEFAASTPIGGIIKMEDNSFVRSVLMLEGLNPEVLEEIMGMCAQAADEMEKEFVGGDEN